jgi:two-component system, cell cycle response regulator DivK
MSRPVHLLKRGLGTDTVSPEGIFSRVNDGLMNEPKLKTVLLVEDNEDNLVVYRTILEHVGFRVLEARDGEEGVSRAKEHLPDLILMDISIPKIDGWEATQRLKADNSTKDIPIIALTAHALEEDRQKALQAGCDGYLAKPVEPRRVVQEVERFVGAAKK